MGHPFPGEGQGSGRRKPEAMVALSALTDSWTPVFAGEQVWDDCPLATHSGQCALTVGDVHESAVA